MGGLIVGVWYWIIPEGSLQNTEHIAKWQWFTKDEFMKVNMNPSYDKAELVDAIFGQ